MIFPKTSQNKGLVKAKVVRREEGVLKCHHPAPPENFNPTQDRLIGNRQCLTRTICYFQIINIQQGRDSKLRVLEQNDIFQFQNDQF